MGNTKQTPVMIDDVEYIYEQLTPEQQILVNHCIDLDRKINSASFNLDQMRFGKEAFVNLLKQKLSEPVEKAEVEVVND